jgi:glutamyl-tRNA reductase
MCILLMKTRIMELNMENEPRIGQVGSGDNSLQIGVIGINYTQGIVNLREEIARTFNEIFDRTGLFSQDFSFVFLYTCNRVELYFSSTSLEEDYQVFLMCLKEKVEKEHYKKIYSFLSSECFFHLSCVITGLNSAITAETEIQGQVKKAYSSAKLERSLSKDLHFLFQKSFKIGKEIRSLPNIKRGVPSHFDLIMHVGRSFFSDLSEQRILFVGASSTNLQIIKRLKYKNLKNVTLCNRSLDKALAIAERENVICLPWEQVDSWINYDLVVVATKYQGLLLKAKDLEVSKEEKKMLIDLSVPRNVDPSLEDCQNVNVLNIDDVNAILNQECKKNDANLSYVEQLLLNNVKRQMHIFKDKGMREICIEKAQ